MSFLLPASWATAEDHPNPAVQQAAKELAVIEMKFNAMRPGDAPTAQALMKELTAIAQSLSAVEEKTHPAWTAAANLYNRLNAGVPAKYKGEGASGPDPEIAKIAAALTDYEKKFEAMAPGDTQTGIRYLDELKGVAARFEKVTTKFHPDYKAIVSRYNTLNNALATKANEQVQPAAPALPGTVNPNAPALTSWQQTQYNRLSRNVASTLERVKNASDAEALADGFASRIEATHADFMTTWAKIDRADREDVARLGQAIESIPQVLQDRLAQAGGVRDSLGDYEASLAEIQAQSNAAPVPNQPQYPFVPDEMREFVERSQAIVAEAQKNAGYLNGLRGSSFAPQDLSSRIHWQQDRLRKAQEGLKQAKASMHATFGGAASQVDAIEDPDSAKHLLDENTFAGYGKFLGEIQMCVDSAVVLFEAENDSEGLARTEEFGARVAGVRGSLDSRFEAALENVRLPEAVSTDSKLLKIARETLESGRYESVNPIAALVVNAPLTHREKEEGDVAGTVTGATITVYKYAWDEYQVTTAEKVGGNYYLFYNTLKHFSSGGSRTPLNRWILSGRFQGSRILEKNLP